MVSSEENELGIIGGHLSPEKDALKDLGWNTSSSRVN
jgi:hypothetical protein